MREISVKAIAAGVMIDIICQMIFGVLLAVGAEYISCQCTNLPREQLMLILSNHYVEFFGFGGATLIQIMSGYIAGLLAPDGANGINSLVVGVVVAASGLLAAFSPSVHLPEWKIVLPILIPVPAALIGGRLAMRRKKRDA